MQPLSDGSKAFFVRDNGDGLSMEQAERLFKPFQRLHSASDYQGHEAGLVTRLRVVQHHGGRIGWHRSPDLVHAAWRIRRCVMN